MLKVADYLKFAAECRKLAQTAATEQQRSMLLAMARTWLELAEERRRWIERRDRSAPPGEKPEAEPAD